MNEFGDEDLAAYSFLSFPLLFPTGTGGPFTKIKKIQGTTTRSEQDRVKRLIFLCG